MVTIVLAVLVACSISFEAPFVTDGNLSASAARPPIAITISASSSALVSRFFSSSGACHTYPSEPLVLGMIVIF